MHFLNAVKCTGATTAGNGRTRIRVIQYAIYDTRGVWIAKKLRSLWQAGCSVRIIYSVSSRPVLRILRDRTGRGPIPMRQSVIRDGAGNIWRYNHSKWMSVVGHWDKSPAAYVTMSGSANWANLAFGSDEQMQRISSRTETLRHVAAFKKTWRQQTSRRPLFGRVSVFGRTMPVPPSRDGILGGYLDPHLAATPQEEPTFGRGIYRYLDED